LRRLQLLLGAKIPENQKAENVLRKTISCPHCRTGELRILRTLSAQECEAYDRRLETSPIPSVARAPPRDACPERIVA
jgi:hypothetical protein